MRRLSFILICLHLTACASDSETPVKDFFGGIGDYFHGGADNSEPPTQLTDYTEEVKIDTLWDESIGVGADNQSLKLVPAIGFGKILAADKNGLVQARDLATGKLIWEAEAQDSNEKDVHFSGGPGIGAGTAILGSSDAEVIALNIETGATLWKSTVTSEVLSVPVIANGIVVVRTIDGAIVAFDEKTGKKRWHYEQNIPALSVRGVSAPIIVENKVICGYDSGKLIALRLEDGKYVWETSVAMPSGRSEVERLVDLDVDPVEEGGIVYVASYQGGISAISQANGEVTWRNPEISSHTGLSKDSQYLYLSDSEGDLLQIDQQSGRSLWKQKELHQRQLTAPAVYGSYVVVGDYDGYVHWLSNSDGRQLGRSHITSAAIDSKPLVVDNVVYVYAKDGTLAALKANLP
ncbi:outer membrane protein assembly factor BamB [Crenothrix polyspora]|uniref:Outer membrane protein assembly factor BamB n=1 Tax=Crenothrix polyspora TaxID=360316 RepID=A0A1R4HJ80_9GAMM|nr:outer membrane protein assembly factor BamB [Crenothrix polyspora]SJM96282.1 Outer membrane protein assembly factor BamB [Crenothrix polyspora]